MPPHWWIPVRGSDPRTRKKEVEDVLQRRGGGKVKSFWKTPDGEQLYALIEARQLDHDLLRDIRTNGRPVPIEDID